MTKSNFTYQIQYHDEAMNRFSFLTRDNTWEDYGSTFLAEEAEEVVTYFEGLGVDLYLIPTYADPSEVSRSNLSLEKIPDPWRLH